MTTLSFDVLWRDRGAQQGMQRLGTATEKTSHSFRALKVAGATALLAVGVAAVKFGSQSVKAYVEAEGSQLKLHEAFRKFPKLADTNIGSLNKLNSALALKTKFDDDATASGQAVLAQFNLTGKQITTLTPLLQDYAAKTGKDLPAAASVLGKAFLGNTKALKAIGINYKSTGDAGKDFQNIQALVNEKVGGFAEKEGKSAAGQAAILRNQFGELQESAGKQLLPALLKVGQGLLKFVGFIGELSPVFSSFKKIAGTVFSSLAHSLGLGHASFKTFADYVLSHQGDIIGGFVSFGKGAIKFGTVLAQVISGALRGFGGFADAIGWMVSSGIDNLGMLLHAGIAAMGWIPGIGPQLKEAGAKFDTFANKAHDNIHKTGDAARGLADGIDGKVVPALEKAGRGLDKVGKKEIFKAEQRDAAKKAALAIESIGTNANGAQIHLKTFADRTKLSAGQQAALHDRIKDAKGALHDQLGAMLDAGVGQGKLTEAWKKGKARLYDEFIQMGLSKREAKELAAKYAGIKPKVSTKFETPGSKAAKAEAKEYHEKLAALHDKEIGIKAKYSHSGDVKLDRLKKFFTGADGGVIPGYSPGVDTHTFVSPSGGVLRLAGGEAVMRPEWTRAVGGAPAVARMNADARSGRLSSAPAHGPTAAFADGGVYGASITTRYRQNHHPNVTAEYQGAVDRATDIARASGLAAAKLYAKAEVKRQKAAIAEAARRAAAKRRASLGGGGGHKMSGSIISIARSFHPSYIAGHRDPQGGPAYDIGSSGAKNNAIANALRVNHGRLGLRYVISQMRIASARSGWGWRRYSPITGSGDFRHVGHVHVSYDKGGILRPGQTATNVRGGTERVLTSRQNSSFERMVRVMDRGGSAGGTTVIINAPNGFIGSQEQFKKLLVDMDRRGQLAVLKR